MNGDYSIERLGVAAYWKWLSLALISMAASIAGLAVTISHPDSHPLVFAFCLFWVISLAVSAVTREGLMRMDPMRFRLAHWEREGRLYHKVGVTAFRWLLLHTPLGWLNPTIKFNSRRTSIEPLLREMNYAEGAHWIGCVLTLGLAIPYLATGHTKIGASLAILTIAFHVYPAILQRCNRGRVLRLVNDWSAHLGMPGTAGAANRSQPVGAQTKRTSAAAGSGR